MTSASFAAATITPPAGTDLCGFARRVGPATGAHDDLQTQWLALDQERQLLLLSSNDVLSFSRNFYAGICKDVAAAAGKPIAATSVATTHTHSGPATVTLRFCGRLDPNYMAQMKEAIVKTGAKAARARKVPVKLKVGRGKSMVAQNRRHPHTGPLDTEVLTLQLIDSQSEQPVATVINYACHPVVMGHENNLVSGDYPAYLKKAVAAKTGAPCMYLNGACGDINPTCPEGKTISAAQKMGTTLAADALRAMDKATLLDENLTFQTQRISVPIQVHQPKNTREIDDRVNEMAASFPAAADLFGPRIARLKQMVTDKSFPRTIDINVDLWSFAEDFAIVFVPGELFSAIGLEIKRISPYNFTMISGYSNGTVGYLPTRQAYSEGGYEPHFAHFFYNYPEFESNLEDTIISRIDLLFRRSIRSK